MSKRDIVERLRDWRSVHLASLHVLMEDAADEIGSLRLTDDERAAVETAAMEADANQHDERAATIRGLLGRLGGSE